MLHFWFFLSHNFNLSYFFNYRVRLFIIDIKRGKNFKALPMSLFIKLLDKVLNAKSIPKFAKIEKQNKTKLKLF